MTHTQKAQLASRKRPCDDHVVAEVPQRVKGVVEFAYLGAGMRTEPLDAVLGGGKGIEPATAFHVSSDQAKRASGGRRTRLQRQPDFRHSLKQARPRAGQRAIEPGAKSPVNPPPPRTRIGSSTRSATR